MGFGRRSNFSVSSIIYISLIFLIITLFTANALIIGGNSTGYYNGTVDEFRIYNKVLTLDEMFIQYNSTIEHLSSSEKVTLTDESGNYNVTFSPPTLIGEYEILVNTTYNSIYGENTQTLTIFNNTAPTVEVEIIPNTPISTDTLNCSANVTDTDIIQNVSFIWYVNEIRNITWDYNLTNCNSTNLCYSGILVENLTNDYNYTCSVRSYDGLDYGSWSNYTVNVGNSPPTVPELYSPANNDYTVHERLSVFVWNASTDPDLDPITYQININSTLCADQSDTNIANTNYTSQIELCLDYGTLGQSYDWQVRACDLTSCSAWSQTWNFSVEPWVAITIVNNTVNFGTGFIPGDTENTSDNTPYPFHIRNDGNVKSDLVNISANNSLWVMQPLGTNYTQIKARNSSETNSFNYSSSITVWTNLTSNNQSIVKQLDYNNSQDEALIDLLIRVPEDESPGQKNITIKFSWEQTP